jgi:hypothetical protein
MLLVGLALMALRRHIGRQIAERGQYRPVIPAKSESH